MTVYISIAQFYSSGNSCGGESVPRTFKNFKEALKNLTDWIKKYKTSIDTTKPKITKYPTCTFYKWEGSFELNGGKITDQVILSYDHTQKEQT